MTAALFAFAAGAFGVYATWNALAEIEASRVASWLRRVAAPIARAEQQGIDASPSERRRLGLVAAAALAAAGWLLAGATAAAAAAIGGPVAARALLEAKRRSHAEQLRRGAPAAARAIADALSSGTSLRGAIPAAALSLPGPAGAALKETARELALGDRTEEALERLRLTADGPAWDTLTAAMLLQRDAGGDLAGLLRDLAEALEAGERLEREARTATSQARFTAWLVGGLPAGGAGLVELTEPGSISGLLADPISGWLVCAAAILQLVGLLAIRRLAR